MGACPYPLLHKSSNYCLTLCTVKDFPYIGEDVIRVLGRVNLPVEAALAVVVDQRERDVVVRGQALLQGLRVVVGAADQRLASHL